ncbi:Rad51B protein [Agrocybe pediades]|nr:Rad51B protein [Agrocybe pediades]
MTLTGVPFSNHGLKDSELALLRKGNFHTVADLLLTSIHDISRRCKASPTEVKRIVDKVLSATPAVPLGRLNPLTLDLDEKFSTGDAVLDNVIGGGISTGMVWEVVGESAAGKTQLALQLALAVQIPQSLGGLSGSACYLTTSSKLPTERLLQICKADPVLSVSSSLEYVHTMPVPTVAFLQNVLTTMLPTFIAQQASKDDGKPVKLLIIDALGELFHSSARTTNTTLFQRSKDITSISACLHELANKHKLAIVVLNEVIDRFTRYNRDVEEDEDLLYENQSRWFSTAEFFGDNKKEASLGLVWANQVNTRIMLTRTGRRRYFSSTESPKRQRLGYSEQTPDKDSIPEQGAATEESQATLLRRLTVIFSTVCSPAARDYIVTEKGIIVLPDDIVPLPQDDSTPARKLGATASLDESKQLEMENMTGLPSSSAPLEDQDDEEYLWSQADPLSDVDWDAFEQKLSQQQT